jgi:hypothetical protein
MVDVCLEEGFSVDVESLGIGICWGRTFVQSCEEKFADKSDLDDMLGSYTNTASQPPYLQHLYSHTAYPGIPDPTY